MRKTKNKTLATRKDVDLNRSPMSPTRFYWHGISQMQVSRSLTWVVFREQLRMTINTCAIQACSQKLPLHSTHNTYITCFFWCINRLKTVTLTIKNERNKNKPCNHVRQWIWSDVYLLVFPLRHPESYWGIPSRWTWQHLRQERQQGIPWWILAYPNSPQASTPGEEEA